MILLTVLVPTTSAGLEKDYFNKGVDNFTSGNYEEARKNFIKSNEFEEDAETLLMVAQSSMKLKDYASCLKYAEKSTFINKDNMSNSYFEARKLLNVGCKIVGYKNETIRIVEGFSYSEENGIGTTDVNLIVAPKYISSVPITLEGVASSIARDSMTLEEILMGNRFEETSEEHLSLPTHR